MENPMCHGVPYGMSWEKIIHGLQCTSDFWNAFSWNLVPMGKWVSKKMLNGDHFHGLVQAYGYTDTMSTEVYSAASDQHVLYHAHGMVNFTRYIQK